mmetsp:Transcript_13613/g.28886  ORF Transcript_13613/g.28886 Transcript_13613/m.28886 type:complete len:208 (-) Transcript_13613:214-837(-)
MIWRENIGSKYPLIQKQTDGILSPLHIIIITFIIITIIMKHQRQLHLGTFNIQHPLLLQQLDTIQKLLLHIPRRMDHKPRALHSIPNLRHGIRPPTRGIHTLLGNHARHLPYRRFELRRPLLIRHLHVPPVQYEPTHLLLVGGIEALLERFGIGELSLGDVGEDAFGLEDFGEVGFGALSVVDDFVAVACHLEAVAAAGEADDGDVG